MPTVLVTLKNGERLEADVTPLRAENCANALNCDDGNFTAIGRFVLSKDVIESIEYLPVPEKTAPLKGQLAPRRRGD